MPKRLTQVPSQGFRRARSAKRSSADRKTNPGTDRDPDPFHETKRLACDRKRHSIEEEIRRLAGGVVNGAVKASEAVEPDPMLGDLSTVASLLRSVVSRAGAAIPDVIAHALSADSSFTVIREHVLPMTRAAAEIVDTNRDRVDVEVTADTALLGSYAADLIVLDCETRHATIFECRRGSVVFSTPKTAATVRTLRIVGLSARKALEAKGYRVASLSVGVIDRYGRSGHDASMSVGPDDIDDLLGVPVLAYLDNFDACIREKLSIAMTPLLRRLLSVPDDFRASCGAGMADDLLDPPNAHEESDPLANNSLVERPSLSRLVGPAERRRARGAGGKPRSFREPAG